MTARHSHFIFLLTLVTLSACNQDFDLALKQKPGPTSNGSDDQNPLAPPDMGKNTEVEVSPGLYAVTARYNVAVAQRKADVLFVIDNSGSMQEEQQNVRNSFSRFLAAFESEGIDFHIGVISTNASTDSADWTTAYNGFLQGGAGTRLSALGTSRFLTSDMNPSRVTTEFRQNVNLGLGGNPAETALMSIQSFLNPDQHQPGAWNENFIRPDALFSTIVVSDEDEGISPSDINYLKSNPSAFDSRISAAQSSIMSLKPARPDLIRFDAIVAPSQAECPTVGQTNGLLGTGDAYIELSRRLSAPLAARVTNICQDFSQSLIDIGQEIAIQVERRFELPSMPDTVVRVSLDGQSIPESATAGFTYDAARNSIELHGLALESRSPRYSIEVTYQRRK